MSAGLFAARERRSTMLGTTLMPTDRSNRRNWIAENAYFQWIEEGGPEGESLRHWLRAESEFRLEDLKADFDFIRRQQLDPLLIHRHIFRQFADATAPHVDSERETPLANWMLWNYVAFAAISIRGMCDRRRDVRSLRRCLETLKPACRCVSRERMRGIYASASPVVDRDFTRQRADERFKVLIGNADTAVLTKNVVCDDINAIEDAAKPVENGVNEWIAHNSAKPTVTSLKLGELNIAIDALKRVFCRYYELLTGNAPLFSPLDDFDCAEDLAKIWPPASR